MNPTPTNISALLGQLGVTQPMVFIPRHDKYGSHYATWDNVKFTEDKEMAFGVAWLLSGIPGGGSISYSGKNLGTTGDEVLTPHFDIDESQFAWTLCLRVATLFRVIHEEDAWRV